MKLVISCILVVAMGILFWGCQSPEMTSARVYIQQKDYPAALEQVRIAEEKEPTNPDVFFLAGQLYAEMDSLVEMNQAFEKALELDSTLTKEIQNWRISKSEDVFEKAIKAGKREKWEEAIEHAKVAVLINPKFGDAWYNLGFYYQKNEQIDEAVKAFSRAYKLNPLDPTLTRIVASDDFKSENVDAAIEKLNNLIENGEPDVPIYTLLAQCYLAKDQPEKAEEALDKAEELDPDNPDLLFDRGVMYFAKKDFDKAAEYFNKTLEIVPESRDARYNLGFALFQGEQYEKATETSEQLIIDHPTDIEGWELYGLSLLRAGESDKGKAASVVAEALKELDDGLFEQSLAKLDQITAKYPQWCGPWAAMKVAAEETENADLKAKAEAGLAKCGG